MPDLKLDNATLSDLTNRVDDYSVDPLEVDSAQDAKETTYLNSNFSKQWGYFNTIPDLKSAIIMKAIWNVGKGYTTDTGTKVILDHVSGWGKDTFDDIIFNMEVMKRVGGDAYCEIIRGGDDVSGTIVNLKPLNPATIEHVVDRKGRIVGYNQINQANGKKDREFKPRDIFHLSNNRLADQIHGISDIDAVEDIIKATQENFEDTRWVMHRQAKPLIMFKLGTDDQTKIDAFIAKMDKAVSKGENVYIPDDENAVSYDVVQISINAAIAEWRTSLKNSFYRTIGLPHLLSGASGGSTESESKIIYLAFEQLVEKDQRSLELQIWNQLGFKVNFLPPASLQTDLQTDEAKDKNQGLEIQPADTAVTPPVQPAAQTIGGAPNGKNITNI